MSEYTKILYQTEGAVARLTLNRPEKRNALDDTIVQELKQALRAAGNDEAVRVVVIEGAGNDFCSGADLSVLQKIAQSSIMENLDDTGSLMELFMQIRNHA